MNNSHSGSNDVLSKIHEWSQDRPLWQRDALRRVLQKSELDQQDIEDLLKLNKKENGFSAEYDIIASPLSNDHFFNKSTLQNSLILKEISDVKGVNILAPNQNLDFGIKGITVVYGDNGSGKSGYTRILKNAGRARHREKIISSIFSQVDETPSATISYQLCEKDGIERIFWEDSLNPNQILSAISIFDSECAKVLIKRQNEIAFKPYGLDIPDKFASACKEVEEKLREELNELGSNQNSIFTSQEKMWSSDTEVGKFISGLSAKTTKEKSKLLSEVSEEEQERLNKINKTLSKDIQQSINSEKLKLSKINNFFSEAERYNKILSDNNLRDLLTTASDLESCKKASKTLAENILSDTSFPDIGNNAWKQLWNSARNFSENYAYKDQTFPVIEGEDKLCILCQQTIDKKTSDRFKNFDSFIRSDIEEKVGNLESKLKNNLNTINSLNFLNDQKFKSLLDDIKIIDKDKYKKLISYIASLRLKKIVFCNNLKRNDFAFTEIVTRSSNLDVLESQKAEISKYIDELLEIQKNNDLSPLKKERNEIADKLTLKKLTSAIDVEIDRLIKIDKLKKCVSAANTRTITQLGNTIANDIITPKLKDAFLKEIIDFIGNRFRVEFEHVGGKYGSPQYKINLIANPKLDVSLILSEGEQTCVAIAAFLAELSTSSHSSPLVFDDPITSLDHKWRDKVAKRLVLEAKNRQVIIFTHDLVFFNDIKEYCEEESVDFSAKQIQRYGEVSGRVDISHPWDGMKVKERIDALEKMARELQKERNNYSEEDYKMRARDFYSKLRASWERGLEQVGLCNVVIRHRDYINSKNLEKISILTLDDCKSWNKNFKKCCNFTNAHDGASARNQSLPEPQELLQDVSELSKWVNDIRERQNPKQQLS